MKEGKFAASTFLKKKNQDLLDVVLLDSLHFKRASPSSSALHAEPPGDRRSPLCLTQTAAACYLNSNSNSFINVFSTKIDCINTLIMIFAFAC